MIKQNPFSLYDFLGYFAPGAIFLYGILLVYGHIENGGLSELPIVFGTVDTSVAFILFSYLIGHVISYLSSIFIERYSNMAFGYPSKFLLGVRKKRMIEHFYYEDEHSESAITVFVWIFSLPIFIWDIVLGKWFNFRHLYSKSLDFFLRKVIIQKINRLISAENMSVGVVKVRNYDFNRVVYHYVLERAHNHVPKFQNYVALYGFLRNVAFISVVGFWLFLAHALIETELTISDLFVSATVLSLFSYVLFMSFVKFYRRYSLEVLMALVSINIDDSKCNECKLKEHDSTNSPS